MILFFDEFGSDRADKVGGKGANLGECTRAGFPVPAGFVVTTEAYREATRAIDDDLSEAAGRGDAAAARARVLEAPVSPDLARRLREAYIRLGEPPVAVRSSATAEDMAGASFAGQQDTYLGIRGVDALIEAVRRCWASLWTDRAVAYRREQGVLDEGLALAVVVQEMVDSDVAGVLFTRNPMGDDDAMLVSSSYGLGESVVAALVTPDTFTVRRSPFEVISREIGTKETRIDAVEGGTHVTDVSPEDRVKASLTDADLERLVDLGHQVENHYGSGQDIEWALVGAELFLLQARPITTGGPEVAGHHPVRGRTERTLRDDLIEHYPGPYPLDLLAVLAVQEVVQDSMRAVGMKALPAAEVVQGDDDGIIRITAKAPRPTPSVFTDLPRTFRRGMGHDPDAWPEEERNSRRRLAALTERSHDLISAPDGHVTRLVEDVVAEAARTTGNRFLNYLAPMMIHRAAASGLMKLARKSDEFAVEDLYEGLDYTTVRITAALGGLVDLARTSGVADVITTTPAEEVHAALVATPEGKAYLESVTTFLAEHGARTTRMYLPFSNMSWREDEGSLYELLAVALRGGGVPKVQTHNAAASVEQALPRRMRGRWRRTVKQLRSMHVGREGTLYLIEEFFVLARRGMNEIARRLVERDVIRSVEDIRFLYYEEATTALSSPSSLTEVVSRRRRRRGTAEAVWWDKGTSLEGADALRGTPGSSGRAVGTVRIVRGPADFGRLQTGDVLVCPYTDPTWTPLFGLSAAVVADTGGPLSHAAIVAREYGIPAVLGTGNGTSRLPDEARVLVDGSAGVVTVEDTVRS